MRRVLSVSRVCSALSRVLRNAPCAARRLNARLMTRALVALEAFAPRRVDVVLGDHDEHDAPRDAAVGGAEVHGGVEGAHGEMDVGDQPRGRRVGGGCVGVAVRARAVVRVVRLGRLADEHHEAILVHGGEDAAHERVGRAATHVAKERSHDLGLTPLPNPHLHVRGVEAVSAGRDEVLQELHRQGKLVGRVRAGTSAVSTLPEREWRTELRPLMSPGSLLAAARESTKRRAREARRE